VEDAVGETLCHDMTKILDTGVKGVGFQRGHVITEADIPALLDMGKSHIFVWEPEADEVHEDDAATALTEVLCGPGLLTVGPVEGKIRISAETAGLFCVHSEALRRINRVQDYTVACRPGYTPVAAGEGLAGARIVPLVTKRKNVEEAVAIAREAYPVFSLRPYLPLRCGVVITGSEVYYGRKKDAFEPIMREKLDAFGAALLGIVKCPDDTDKILAAIQGFIEQDAELILLTGGMSVDPDDLTPGAIRMSGARLVTQGVPMQPGNMLTVAYLGKTALVGVPGASMHMKTTSLDVFLPRLFAGIPLTEEMFIGRGEGGFCMNCKVCRWPICCFGLK
jgi:hypothetical protein